MTPSSRPDPLWRADMPATGIRAEIYEHAAGWECRITRHGSLLRSRTFADLRAAHADGTQGLVELGFGSGTPNGR
jgi:hypothetical protein